MTPKFETWLDTDLTVLPHVVPLPDDTFTADAQANKVGVRVTKAGQSVTVSGTIKGYIIKPDGSTITVNGSKSGNTAYVILPATAYTAPGKIMVIIKSLDGETVTTLGACECIMHRTTTEVHV